VDKSGKDTPLLYTDRFKSEDGRALFYPVDFTPPANPRDQEFTLHLNNGRVLEHFHEGNFTHRNAGLRSKVVKDYVDVAPADAEAMNVQEGDWVRLISPFGEVKTQVVITGEVRPGEMYMPVCSSDERVNYLTSSKFDPVVKTPAYKEISVKLEKLGRSDSSPMPRGNPRFGHPTPQAGVKVEQKMGTERLPLFCTGTPGRSTCLMPERLEYAVPTVTMPGARDELADLLETLHRSGTLRVLNGFFGKLGNVTDVALDEVNSEPGRNLLGALLFLGECLSKVPAEDLAPMANAFGEGLQRVRKANAQKPPGIFALLRLLREPETRRAIGAVLLMLNRLGATASHPKDEANKT